MQVELEIYIGAVSPYALRIGHLEHVELPRHLVDSSTIMILCQKG